MYTRYYFIATCTNPKFGDIVDYCSILELSLELAISEVKRYYTHDGKSNWEVISICVPTNNELETNEFPEINSLPSE